MIQVYFNRSNFQRLVEGHTRMFNDVTDFIEQKRVLKFAKNITVETIKLVAATIFLHHLHQKFVLNPTLNVKSTYHAVVIAPLIEEILFRGIFQRGIWLTQKGWNHLRGVELTEESEKAQQIFRMHLSALAFAAAHLTNEHTAVWGALYQFSHCYLSGLSYGYLSEKYHTLSLSIIVHGLNNFLACAPGPALLRILAAHVQDVAIYILATADSNVTFIKSIQQHPWYKMTVSASYEVIKIAAAAIFLQMVTNQFLLIQVYGAEPTQNIVLILPIAWEIIFRGMLPQGIRLLQKAWNHIRNVELTQEDEKTQRIFRIHLSVCFSAAASFYIVPQKSAAVALTQFAYSYLSGVAYGYLAEKYRTTSLGIVSHGFDHALQLAQFDAYAEPVPIFRFALYTHRAAVVALAVTNVDEKINSGMRQTALFCRDLPGRCKRWYAGEQLAGAAA